MAKNYSDETKEMNKMNNSTRESDCYDSNKNTSKNTTKSKNTNKAKNKVSDEYSDRY